MRHQLGPTFRKPMAHQIKRHLCNNAIFRKY